MEFIETLPQKIVDQKIVILKPRLDSAKAKMLGEENKIKYFIKSRFSKPKQDDIELIDFNKFYEPVIVVGGKYSIDYCKKHLFEIKTDNEAKRIFIGGEEVKLEGYDPAKPKKPVRLIGEEHCHYVNETFIVIDKFKRELSFEKVHLAPFEDNLENVENSDLRKINISEEEEIQFIKSKIVKRPPNSDFVIKEVFEINDRMIIYNPIYELVFQHIKTSQMITLLIDGVTGKFTVTKLISASNEEPPVREKQMEQRRDVSVAVEKNDETSYIKDANDQKLEMEKKEEEIHVNQEKTIVDPPVIESPPSIINSPFEPENATLLASNLLKRLGFKNKITPLKVIPEGDSYIVELSMQNKVAKMLVNTKTKEVKEYDIQESNSF